MKLKACRERARGLLVVIRIAQITTFSIHHLVNRGIPDDLIRGQSVVQGGLDPTSLGLGLGCISVDLVQSF